MLVFILSLIAPVKYIPLYEVEKLDNIDITRDHGSK